MATALSKQATALQPADIMVIFGSLQQDVPEIYYTVKMNVLLQAFFPGYPETKAEKIEPAKLNLVAKEQLPAITKELQKRIDCLMETADEKYPLLADEYVIDDFVSILAEPLEEIPAGTVVLQRTTNFATLYYVVKNVKMEGDTAIAQEIEFDEALQLQSSSELKARGGLSSLPLTIAKGIGAGMVSGVGGFIAKAILESIFPSGVPDYFDNVYKEVAKIVDQKIDQGRIDSINGAISNLVDKLANEYKPAKDVCNLKLEKDRRRLYDLLQKYDQTFLSGPSGMLGSLQQDKVAKAGFGVFMMGAAIQLAIFQEMANIDPYNGDEKNGWKSPLESSYGMPKTGSVAKMAKNYADFASKTWVKIVDDRKALVKPEKFGKRFQPHKHNKYAVVVDVVPFVRVQDDGAATSIEQKIGKDDKDGKNPRYDSFCNNQLVTYKNQKAQELATKMSDPAAIISGWQSLMEKPILIG